MKCFKLYYKLSDSTFQRMIKEIKSKEISFNNISTKIANDYGINLEAEELIKKWLNPPQKPITIARIKSKIKEELGVEYKIHQLRAYVRNKLRFRFKKGCSRPPKYTTPSIAKSKFIFWTDLLRHILNGDLIFNIDESSFERSVKKQYSWLPIGRSSQIINESFKGKCSLILGISNYSSWFAVVKDTTIDSIVFSACMKMLERLLRFKRLGGKTVPKILLDNARTHKSKLTLNVIAKLKIEVWFLPPYCPEVTPVEHIFGVLKSKLRADCSSATLDFSKVGGISKIMDALHNISYDSWKNSWVEVIKESQRTIKTFKELNNLTRDESN